jgi:hypothetical protein
MGIKNTRKLVTELGIGTLLLMVTLTDESNYEFEILKFVLKSIYIIRLAEK